MILEVPWERKWELIKHMILTLFLAAYQIFIFAYFFLRDQLQVNQSEQRWR